MLIFIIGLTKWPDNMADEAKQMTNNQGNFLIPLASAICLCSSSILCRLAASWLVLESEEDWLGEDMAAAAAVKGWRRTAGVSNNTAAAFGQNGSSGNRWPPPPNVCLFTHYVAWRHNAPGCLFIFSMSVPSTYWWDISHYNQVSSQEDKPWREIRNGILMHHKVSSTMHDTIPIVDTPYTNEVWGPAWSNW